MSSPLPAIDRSQLQALVPAALARLNEIASLPEYGTVAGQAVASVFQELLGHTARGPINDVDVFVNKKLPRAMRGLSYPAQYKGMEKQQQLGWNVKQMDETTGNYSQIKDIVARSNLSILSTYRVGLTNYTLIAPHNKQLGGWGHDREISQDLVEGFDLNLVGVGINLQTQQVVATDEYIQFLSTCQVRVKTCNTPIHTLIRLAHKMSSGQFSGVECDYGHERGMLEAAIYCQSEQLKGRGDNTCLVGTFGNGRYKTMYEENQHLLPPIQKVPKEGPVSEDDYILNYLSVQRPENPNVQPLIDHLSNVELPDFLKQLVLCGDFPKIYDLFTKPAANQRARQESFLSLNSDASPADAIALYFNTIGRAYQKPQSYVFDDVDSAIFFFNQSHGATHEKQQIALHAYEASSEIERYILTSMHLYADTFVSVSQDRQQAWQSILVQNPSAVLNLLASHSMREHGSEFTKEMMEWTLDLSAPDCTRVVRHLVGATPWDQKSSQGSDSELAALLSKLPQEEQLDMGTRLFQQLAPNWPNVEGVLPQDANALLAHWLITLNQPLPPEFMTTYAGPLSDCLQTTLEFLHDMLGGINPGRYTAPTDILRNFLLPDMVGDMYQGAPGMPQNLEPLIDQFDGLIHGDDLLKHNGHLLFVLMSHCTPEKIKKIMLDASFDTPLPRTLPPVLEVLDVLPDRRKNTFITPDFPDGVEHIHRWTNFDGASAYKSALMGAFLVKTAQAARSSGDIDTPATPKHKIKF